jgi:hypothetical protein
MSVRRDGSFGRRVLSREGFTAVSHVFVMEWAAIWKDLVGGPLLAMISFVCSIGNVPLAVVLWKGGISFGGAVAFIFADLIILPVLNIYRKYYRAPPRRSRGTRAAGAGHRRPGKPGGGAHPADHAHPGTLRPQGGKRPSRALDLTPMNWIERRGGQALVLRSSKGVGFATSRLV